MRAERCTQLTSSGSPNAASRFKYPVGALKTGGKKFFSSFYAEVQSWWAVRCREGFVNLTSDRNGGQPH